MSVVVGPLFSMSASGLFKKALLFYDTKYGARVRAPKKTFVPPGNIWEVNIEWFKKASVRSKTLDFWQKRAWSLAYLSVCDVWRDIFMGKQIEAWNLSPLNDLTWPLVDIKDVGPITFAHGMEFEGEVRWWVETINGILREKYSVGYLWWKVLDDDREPVEDDLVKATLKSSYEFEFTAGHDNYLWGGVRYINGSYKAVFLKKYVR